MSQHKAKSIELLFKSLANPKMPVQAQERPA